MKNIDVLVIGGGPGGTPAAMALASGGRSVILVEKGGGLGGTCLFEGCIPSKILRESAQRLRAIQHAGEFGLQMPAGEVGIDWSAIMRRKAAILKGRSEGALQHARHIPTLTVQFGSATLLGPRQARIVPENGEPEDIEFANAIIATGSVPHLLPIEGIDLPQVGTSEQLLEVERPPKRLVVIGAGPIGVEMAQIFAAFGSQVSLIEAGPRILAPVDEEIALALQTHITSQGIALQLGAQVLGISTMETASAWNTATPKARNTGLMPNSSSIQPGAPQMSMASGWIARRYASTIAASKSMASLRRTSLASTPWVTSSATRCLPIGQPHRHWHSQGISSAGRFVFQYRRAIPPSSSVHPKWASLASPRLKLAQQATMSASRATTIV